MNFLTYGMEYIHMDVNRGKFSFKGNFADLGCLGIAQYGEEGRAIAHVWVALPQIRADRRKVGTAFEEQGT
jgi:hypothetical protein